jgi:hypothetical protein
MKKWKVVILLLADVICSLRVGKGENMLLKNRKSIVDWMALFAFVAIFVSGCATIKPMALDNIKAIELDQRSVALMTVKTSNQYRPNYQPNVCSIFIWTTGKEGKEKYTFSVEKPYNSVENQFNEYLISIDLPPGKYKLREIFGTSGIFPFRGMFSIPIYVDFELKPNKVIYLGRIEAVVRERKNDSEMRAGPVIPLVDQAVTGFSGGTFDVRIFDNYDEDIVIFKQKYPVLNNYAVEKAILPSWKKPSEEDMK